MKETQQVNLKDNVNQMNYWFNTLSTARTNLRKIQDEKK
jgi:hypothetical protein